MANAFRPGREEVLPVATRELVARRQRLLGSPYRLFYETPVHLVSGQGVWLQSADGERYLDAYNNVQSVGHAHPAVVEALRRQAETLATHTRYADDIILDYAEKLLSSFPAELSKVMFTCTGSEANDLALRVAKSFTGGTGCIVTQHAYHGVTESVAALSPSLGPGVPLGSHVRTIDAPSDADPELGFANRVQVAAEDLERHGIKPAALIVDTIFSSDGVRPDRAGFLHPAAEAIRQAGGVFIADEVQAGFGRTGAAMWGFDRHGVTPDLVTVGKPIGNGYPMGATIARPELLERFAADARYFNTFGGTPVAGAVGMSVLDVIRNEDLIRNARIVGAHLKQRFQELQRQYDEIGDVRGCGLFLGVDINDADTSKPDMVRAERLVNDLRDRRILISASGPCGNVLKIRPPLVFTREHADLLLSATEECLRLGSRR